MGKETKIGLTVVGVLLLVFGALLYRKLTTHDGSSTPVQEAITSAAESAPLTKALTPPAVETAAESAPRAEGIVKAGWTTPHTGAPRDEQPSEPTEAEMPAEEVAVEPPLNRYAQVDEPSAEEPVPSASTRANPFRKSQPASADEIPPSDNEIDEEPKPLVAVPPRPKQLAAEQEEPIARTHFPIRRAGAQLPLEENASEPEANADRYGSNSQELQPADTEPQAVFDRDLTIPEAEPPREEAPAVRSQFSSPAENAEPAPPEDGKYTVQPNDNLWNVSEKVYGNGRYFKAIAEHNRAELPQPNRLTVGTVLSVPPVSVLEQNYPALCPKQRKSALVKSRTVPASTRQRMNGDSYLVEEGDTLFDIARHELGKASRWAEIYDLNREALGEDFDYLQPGTELIMPPKPTTDAITRQRGTGVQR